MGKDTGIGGLYGDGGTGGVDGDGGAGGVDGDGGTGGRMYGGCIDGGGRGTWSGIGPFDLSIVLRTGDDTNLFQPRLGRAANSVGFVVLRASGMSC